MSRPTVLPFADSTGSADRIWTRTPTQGAGAVAVDQLRQLRALHCNLAQGYYFSRPVPAEQLTAMLEAKAPLAAELRADEAALKLVS